MKEISNAELKVMMMDILEDVQRFCDEKGLRYYLSYGYRSCEKQLIGFLSFLLCKNPHC